MQGTERDPLRRRSTRLETECTISEVLSTAHTRSTSESLMSDHTDRFEDSLRKSPSIEESSEEEESSSNEHSSATAESHAKTPKHDSLELSSQILANKGLPSQRNITFQTLSTPATTSGSSQTDLNNNIGISRSRNTERDFQIGQVSDEKSQTGICPYISSAKSPLVTGIDPFKPDRRAYFPWLDFDSLLMSVPPCTRLHAGNLTLAVAHTDRELHQIRSFEHPWSFEGEDSHHNSREDFRYETLLRSPHSMKRVLPAGHEESFFKLSRRQRIRRLRCWSHQVQRRLMMSYIDKKW